MTDRNLIAIDLAEDKSRERVDYWECKTNLESDRAVQAMVGGRLGREWLSHRVTPPGILPAQPPLWRH